MEKTLQRDTIGALVAAHDGRLRVRLLPDAKDDKGALHHALEVSGPELDPVIFYVDPATNLIAKQAYVAGGPGRPLIEEIYSDYRAVDGVQMAFAATVRQGGRQVVDRRVTQFKINEPLAPSLFKRPSA
jgi:hypothetical protein